MATVGTLPAVERSTAPAVHTCYDLLTVAPVCGVTDFTDGKYVDDRNDRTAYLAAQERQSEYLLDEVRCDACTRLLDIGCGYGRLMEHAARRGAKPVGITISPPQVASCRARGLDVRELNYRNIFASRDQSWEHSIDAIIANGSLEHFVQVEDAVAGRADEIYDEMFAICQRLLRPGGRFATTAIHFRAVGQFKASEIARGPHALPHGSPERQFAMLAAWFGGWYPEPGHLERCARPYFELVHEEDGTHDYYLTSEYWLARFKQSLAFDPRVWWSVAEQIWQHPKAAYEMLRLQLWDQSWAWQFRPPAPMRLLRQTWVAKGVSH
ncbi:MAG TPA: class I SAM-dependent methyltransferase [Lacipirellulaceae bacterium]|nr:class I SAM-dependent methyltransferase [Lacipirellulaceae bacterium]